MNPDFHTMATDLLNAGMGDEGRLNFILECIQKDKPLYRTDQIYLESMTHKLNTKIEKLRGATKSNTSSSAQKSSKVVITDEHLDEIIARRPAKLANVEKPVKKRRRSILSRLFSR